jgi:broad specificity polyphosphatase/5'/3'-nucleotidase SurE
MGIIRTSIIAATLFCFSIDLVFIDSGANQAIKDCVSGTVGGILQVLVGQVRALRLFFVSLSPFL